MDQNHDRLPLRSVELDRPLKARDYSQTGNPSRVDGIKAFEQANRNRFEGSKGYKELKKADDLLYLKESQFILLGEDAGMYNRNARDLLTERLKLRNLCGHPTSYQPGREETVVFVESLMLNVLGGGMINW